LNFSNALKRIKTEDGTPAPVRRTPQKPAAISSLMSAKSSLGGNPNLTAVKSVSTPIRQVQPQPMVKQSDLYQYDGYFDTLICGHCQSVFHELEKFIEHRRNPCSPRNSENDTNGNADSEQMETGVAKLDDDDDEDEVLAE